MRQVRLWMLAAILVISGTSVLTSCSKDDDNNTDGQWYLKPSDRVKI